MNYRDVVLPAVEVDAIHSKEVDAMLTYKKLYCQILDSYLSILASD